MESIIKKFAFWMGIAAVLLVLGREFVFSTSQWQNVLSFANLPLFAVLHTFFPDVLQPIPPGAVGSYALAYLPYYALYVLTYIGYGFIADFIIRKLRKSKIVAEA